MPKGMFTNSALRSQRISLALTGKVLSSDHRKNISSGKRAATPFFKKSGYLVNENGCWIWGGKAHPKTGYGKVSHNNKTYLAHRLFYELIKGEIPVGKVLDHLCRTRICINPEHLEPVSQKENINRGLGTKLSEHDVKQIRLSYSEGETQTNIARTFNVNQSQVSRIVNKLRRK